MIKRGRIPWAEIRREYEQGGTSYAGLGRRYGVCANTIGEHARRENWQGRSREEKKKLSAEGWMTAAVRQLRRSIEESVKDGEGVSVKEWKELTAMLRELLNLEQAISNREDAEENRLRIVMDEAADRYSG